MKSTSEIADTLGEFVSTGTGPFYETLVDYLVNDGEENITEVVTEYREVLKKFMEAE